jgi:soluble lytic murein transglycosylase-like protein
MLCACAVPQDSAGSGNGYTTSSTFSNLLSQYEKLTDSQRIDELEAIQSSGVTSPADRQQACYMLARLLQKIPASSQAQATPLPTTTKDVQVKNAQRAIQLYQTASDQSALWLRCQLHIAECAAVTGQEKIARESLNKLMNSKDASRQEKAQAQYCLAQSYLRAGEKDNALKTFETVREHFPKTEYATGALYYLGSINLSSANTEAGLNYFRKYLSLSPDGHFAADIVQQLQALPEFIPTAHDHVLFAQALFVQGKFKEALDNLTKFQAQTHSNMHFFEQASCMVKLSDTDGARRVLQSGIYAHPNSADVVSAAQLYSRLSSRLDALKIWQVLLKSSPHNADVALWNMAARQDMSQATASYHMLVQKYPNSKFAPEASWWLIWWHDPTHSASGSVVQLRSALKRYGQSKAAPRFAFWIGKYEEALKQTSQARSSYQWTSQHFPSSYYGWRARARLAKLNGGSDPGWATTPKGCSADLDWDWPNEPNQIKFEDVAATCGYPIAVLTMLKQWDEAQQLMEQQGDSLDQQHAELPIISAWCLANQNLPLEAINAAAIGIDGPPQNSIRWQFAYPLLYGKLISANAHSKHVDPCLIHALIREESRYFSHALSRSNALGLMQLLPSTAASTAATCGITLNGTQDCFNPDINVRLGTAYFASLQQRFNGNDLLAVAAYNGGPGAVNSWKSESADPDIYVEDIPIDETRDYVRKVFGSYWCYRRIYDSNF